MKQIIPFVKDLELGTRVSEITSIALEHNLQMENDDSIVGDFVVSGKYKINEISINEEVFEKIIPFDITLDDKYDASKVTIDIDDFYYEIINDEYLRVHIDVLTDNLVYAKKEEVNLERDNFESITNVAEELTREIDIKENLDGDERDMIEIEEIRNDGEGEVSKPNIDIANNLSSNFLNAEEKYITYKVHIVRESDTIEQIKEKYNVTTEELEKYNTLDNIMLGTKLIIPVTNE